MPESAWPLQAVAMAPCYQLSKILHWGFGQYGSIAQWHLSAQRDRAPADLRSTVAMMVRVAKEREIREVFVCTLFADR